MSFVEGNLQLGIELAPGTLERLRGNLANLEKGINLKVNIDPKPLQQAAGISDNLTKSINSTADSLSNRLGTAAKATAATFGVLAAAGGTAMVGIAVKAIQAGKEFNVLQQQVRAGLTAILGTTVAATDLLGQVNKLNDTSPFPRSAFLSATQQLVGFGVQAQKVVPIIDAVQNAVAGIGGGANDIAMFTRAFAQIQSQGRLTGDVLFTLGEKGIDAAAIIGKQMGQTGQEIKDAVTAGTIDSAKAIDALTVGLKTKFNGAVENVSQSFLGATDRVHARLRDIGADITKAFINPLGGGAAVEGLNNIAVGLSNIRKNVLPQLIPGITTLAELFVKATKAFADFTSGIKGGQVQDFLNILKTISPVIALVGTTLVKSLGQGIPILRNFTGALSGPVLAIAAFALSVPAVRDAILKMAEALQPAVNSLLPAFADILKKASDIVTAAAPAITLVAGAIGGLIQVITPLLSVLTFGPVQAALLILIARFGMLKLTGTSAFQSVGYAALQMSAGIQGAAKEANLAAGAAAGTAGQVGKLTTAANLGKAAMGGLGNVLGSLITPTNFFLGALTIVISKLSEMKRIGAEAAAATRKAILDGLDVNAVDDFSLGVKRSSDKIDELKKKLAGLTGGTKGITNAFDPSAVFGIFGNTNTDKSINATRKSLTEAQKVADELATKGAIKSNVISDVMAAAKKTTQEVTTKVAELGIRLTDISPDQVASTVAKIVKAFGEIPAAMEDATAKVVDKLRLQADALDKVRAAGDTLKASQRSLADLQRSAVGDADAVTRATQALTAAREAGRAAADKVALAEISLAAAQRGVTDATDRLNQLVTTRNRLLADTGREAREVADAEATLARTGMTLIDQDERRIELQQDLERLAREGPDKLAAADRSIERAKIALNTATRDELTLLKETNKHQTSQVDLKGLSVEQIKLKLAGVRAELDSQRTSRGTLKTQQQINDEAKTASLNRLDAEQGLKDAIQGRTDLENEQNVKKREDEEGLKSLAIDHEDSLRRQTEQQTALSILRSGDTQTARDLKQLNNEIVGATDDVKKAVIAVHTEEDGLKQAKIDQRNLTIDIRDREREVAGALNTQKEHITDIKSAQQKVKEDALAYKEAIATASGDHKEINRLLLERIGLNNTILKQNPLLLRQLAESIVGPALTTGGHGGPGAMQRETKINTLIDIITNHPEQLLDTLRNLGLQFADGAVVNSATFATIGEAGREVVLPLTRPARLEELLSNSQVLPPVLAALGRISLPGRTGSSLSPSADSIIKPLSGSGGTNVVVRREDGPMTYAQAQSIIGLLKENGKATISVTAPITVESSTNEDELVRKISRRVERQVNEILDKRRR